MKNDRQPVLDALQVDAATAIGLAELNTLTHCKRPVNQRTQKRILQIIGGYRSDDCYLTAEAISKRIAMDEKTVRAAIRALVADGLLLEWGPRNRRHLKVHWTEIGRRIPRLETGGRRPPTAAVVSQGAEVATKSAGPRTHAHAPEDHPQGDHTVTRGVHCEPATTNAKGTRQDHSPGVRSGQWRPDATGQSADDCPDDPDNRATIARIIPDNREPIARLNRAVAARTYKEQENNLTTSSSKALAMRPPTGGDDDDEGSLPGCTIEPSGWTPEREAEVAAEIQAAGVYAWRESIDKVKRNGIEPDAVMDALYVAMNYRDPHGKLLLGQSGFVAWTRTGFFPCDNPPTAAELRERRQREADEIRKATRATAAAAKSAPSQRLILAVTFERLVERCLQDLASREEREANAQWERHKAAQPLDDHYQHDRTGPAEDHRGPGTTPAQPSLRDHRTAEAIANAAGPRTHAHALDDHRQHGPTATAEDRRGPGATPAQRGLRDHRTAEAIANAARPRTNAHALDDHRQQTQTATAEDHHGPGTTPAQRGLPDHQTAGGIANADAPRPTDKPLGVGVSAAVR